MNTAYSCVFALCRSISTSLVIEDADLVEPFRDRGPDTPSTGAGEATSLSRPVVC